MSSTMAEDLIKYYEEESKIRSEYKAKVIDALNRFAKVPRADGETTRTGLGPDSPL